MVLTEERKTLYYPAATLECTFTATSPQANIMVNYQMQFYTIDYSKGVNGRLAEPAAKNARSKPSQKPHQQKTKRDNNQKNTLAVA